MIEQPSLFTYNQRINSIQRQSNNHNAAFINQSNQPLTYITYEQLQHSPSSLFCLQKSDLRISKLTKVKDIKISYHKLPNRSINNNQFLKSILTTEMNQKNMNIIQNEFYDNENQQRVKKQTMIFEKLKEMNSQASQNYQKIQKKHSKKGINQYRNSKQIRSQNKPQKSINHNNNALNKQNSHHYLQKNYSILDKNPSFSNNQYSQSNPKLQQRLHLPSLVQNNQNSVNKNIKGKLYQNISALNSDSLNDQKYIEMSPDLLQTDKLTPSIIQKVIKIPIQRLKPLRPQEIKLKYQKKIKQQQRNRAKDIAIHIFNREQEQKFKYQNYDDILTKQIQLNYQDQNNNPFSVDSRLIRKNYLKEDLSRKNNGNIFSKQNPEKMDNESNQYQIKTSIKKEKAINYQQNINSNEKSQNIFKNKNKH